MNTENIKHWFISLKNTDNTINKFHGEKIYEGLGNIVLSHLLISILATTIMLSATETTPNLAWPILFLFIGISSWLARTYLYHSFAALLGGKGNYLEYAVKTSFPIAGSIAIGTFLILIMFLMRTRWTIVYFIMILIPLHSIIRITQKEYEMEKTKAIAAVIIPTALIVILSNFISL